MPSGGRCARCALAVLVFAIHAPVSELVQHFLLPGRSGDGWDVVLDLVGVAVGAAALVVGDAAAPLVDFAASDSEVSSDHDGRDAAGDARRAGSSDEVTPTGSSRHRARPVTDAERIRSPDGTDAGNRSHMGAPDAPEARLHGRGVTHGSRRSLLESRELNTHVQQQVIRRRAQEGPLVHREEGRRAPRSRTAARARRPTPGSPSRPASSGSSHVGGREWRAPRDEHRSSDRPAYSRDDRGDRWLPASRRPSVLQPRQP